MITVHRLLRASISLVLLFITTVSWATPVGPMNYQGRLLDTNGVPVTGSYDFVVNIYDDPSAGTLKYQETLNSVSVNDGVYALKVGLGPKTGGDSEWDVALWQGNINDLYLGIDVRPSGGGGYDTLTPRQELTSAPHAFTATLALSLGNRTAEEFDNILEGICVADKGKWLVTADRCAGNGSDLSGALWSDLDPSNDYSNLSFVDTDFSGANFSSVNFSGATIQGANLDNANLGGVNLTDASIDGATFAIAPVFGAANLTNATISNMSLAGVDLSSANLTNFSAAKLSSCAGTSLPSGWECVDQLNGTWAVIGPGANYSETSAGLISRYGLDNYLDLVSFGSVTNLSNSDFSGIFSDLEFIGISLIDTVFDYSQIVTSLFQNTNMRDGHLQNAKLDWTIFNNANMEDTLFDWSVISNATFEWNGMLRTSFYGASISGTNFSSTNNGSTYHNQVNPETNFTLARLRNVEFDTADISGSNFTDAFLINTYFYDTVNDDGTLINFIDARLENVYFVTSQFPIWADFSSTGYGGLYNVDFTAEDFGGSYFWSTYLYNCYFDGASLQGADFDGADIDYTSFDGANLTGAYFNNADLSDSVTFAGATLTGVTWTNAICPDGNHESTGAPGCQDQL